MQQMGRGEVNGVSLCRKRGQGPVLEIFHSKSMLKKLENVKKHKQKEDTPTET
jgi:hypothetical protein